METTNDAATMAAQDGNCRICNVPLNQPDDPATKDCGGDCLSCMASVGDEQCQRELDEARARKAGWNNFEDAEDSALLVVAHDDRPVHFTGTTAWAECLAWDAQHGYADTQKERG